MKRLLNGRSSLFSTSSIIIFLLSLLGFTCSRIGEAAMYGVPTATYRTTVKVRNVENEPLQKIDISFSTRTFRNDYNDDYESYSTDAKGEVSVSYQDFPQDTLFVKLLDNTRVYKDTIVKSPVLESERTAKGSGSWNEGEYTKDLTVILEKIEVKE